MIDQNKVSRWIRRACGIHLFILLILCLTLPAIATTPIQQTIFNIVTQDLKIITQMSTSSYPFLSVMSSVYALVSGLGLFLVFLLILKKLEPNYPFRAVLYARFAEQLSPIEQLKWFRLVGKFVTFVLTLGLISFHFFVFNHGVEQGGKGDVYVQAFDSRWGIFIVQSIASFWLCASWILLLLWYLQTEMWWHTRKD